MSRSSFSLAVLSVLFMVSSCLVEERVNDELLDLGKVQQEVLSPVAIKSGDMNILLYGCFVNSKLRWSGDGSCYGPYFYGSNLSAQYKSSYNGGNTQVNDPWNGYPGECVSLVKSLASRSMGGSSSWVKGAKVVGGSVSIGTVIATFRSGNNFNPNGSDHTGFFAGYSGSCFLIFDQNWSPLMVGKHTICVTNSGTTGDANAYYVVNVP